LAPRTRSKYGWEKGKPLPYLWGHNPRGKTSPIWKISSEELKSVIESSESISEILSYFNLSNKGGNYKTLYQRLDHEGFSKEHIPKGGGSNKGRKFPNAKRTPMKEILVKNSSFSRYHLKNRLIKENLLEYKCQECGSEPIWREKELILRLDHINGISNDNRLKNLRFLCPNCDSQQSTYCGRNNLK
jgi:predicted RNA-binding Zn-ribbon protein involved in translation (DUF1610 family)